jgi:hypothetical protein
MPEWSHQTIRLSRGRHSSPADGACVMELASMLAGESFSDHPQSVCPVIGEFLRTYNDAVDDERRQDLYAYAAAVAGTRRTRMDERLRARLCAEAIRRCAGRWGTAWRPWRAQVGCRAAARLAGTRGGHPAALELLDRLIAVAGGPRLAASDLATAPAADAAENVTCRMG